MRAWPILLLFASFQQAPRDFHGDPLPPGVTTRLGTIRFRHWEDVWAVAFQPDGKVIVAVDYGSTHWWDAASGLPARSPVKREGRGSSASFSADTKRFASGEYKKPDGWMIGVYDSATGKVVRSFKSGADLTGQPIGVALTADGSKVAHAGVNGESAAWDVETGAKLADFKGHEGHVLSVAFSPDGRIVATGGEDKTIRFWNPATGGQTGRIDAPHKFYNLAMSKDGARIAGGSSDDRAVRVWDVASAKELYRIEHKDELNFYPRFDGSELRVVAGAVTSFHDAATGAELRRLAAGGYGSGLSPDGTRLAAAYGNQVRQWDAKTGAGLHPVVPSIGAFQEGWFSPDDATFKAYSSSIHAWECPSGRAIASTKLSPYTVHYGFSPDRRRYARSVSHREVALFNAADDRETARLDLPMDVMLEGLALSQDGKRLVVLDRNGGRLHILDATSGAVLHMVLGRATQAAFSPDGSLVAAGGEQGTINFWDVETGAHKASIPAGKYRIGTIRFAPDGRSLVAATSGSGIQIRTLAGDMICSVPSEGILGIPIAALSPDGRYVAGPVANSEVKVWEAATGAEVMHIVPDRGFIRMLVFTHVGTRIAIVAGDGNVHLWDLRSGIRNAATLDELWEDLASKDAKRAHQAVGALSHQGDAAAAFMKERLIRRPKRPEDYRKWFADLSADDIETRNRATAELAGFDAIPEYRKVLEAQDSPVSVTSVLRSLLDEGLPIRSEDLPRLRRLRAVTALAWSGSKESNALLRELASVVTDARIRESAAQALKLRP